MSSGIELLCAVLVGRLLLLLSHKHAPPNSPRQALYAVRSNPIEAKVSYLFAQSAYAYGLHRMTNS